MCIAYGGAAAAGIETESAEMDCGRCRDHGEHARATFRGEGDRKAWRPGCVRPRRKVTEMVAGGRFDELFLAFEKLVGPQNTEWLLAKAVTEWHAARSVEVFVRNCPAGRG